MVMTPAISMAPQNEISPSPSAAYDRQRELAVRDLVTYGRSAGLQR